MPLKVLIVPDKFKGTLSAETAARQIAAGWSASRPEDFLQLLPMSDGGDGFGHVLAGLLKVETRHVETVDPARRPRRAEWWWEPNSRTAIIESAQIIGLALMSPAKWHPFQLDTFGLGAAVEAAAAAAAQRCLMGIGGSATNDGGFGLARALGWDFRAADKTPITRWTDLAHLAHVQPPKSVIRLPEVLVAVDVQNPLLGPAGATRVYGPQKGLRVEDFPVAEQCLDQLAEVVERDLGLNVADEPGVGAAGGLGFGLRCFLNALLEPGFTLFAGYAHLEERIRCADVVVTGEGAIDASTLMGKGVGEVANLARRLGKPCLGLAGAIGALTREEQANSPFQGLYAIVPELASLEQALVQPECWLERLAATAAARFRNS